MTPFSKAQHTSVKTNHFLTKRLACLASSFLLFGAGVLASGFAFATETDGGATSEPDYRLEYYFNQALDYDENVAEPSKVLAQPMGQWHLRPDQSVRYFQALADSTDKVAVKTIGRSHENRELLTAYISTPENIAKLEQFKEQRKSPESYKGPTIVWLGYSVHGNEASGANAAPLVAYRLAASKEAWVQELLENTIVMIDPMLNPDGMGRFASWVNRYKGKELVADSASTEHNESWPAGRTNHYWFDLNRDWLLLQHPESQARVAHFYEWRPHIVGDFHEMGTNSTYFFQPGVHSRQNPLTSENNFDITNEIATYHAKELDAIQSSYYSKESFDDFYYGKGSTFPDINGGVGILFEQASARGHVQESIHGDVSFPFAIRNHIATSISTLKASLNMKAKLHDYQKDFFSSWVYKASRDSEKAVVFTSKDTGRMQEMLRLLQAHQISAYPLNSDKVISGDTYSAQHSYVVPFKQIQYGLIKAIFEQRTAFKDNTFYDVSAWTLPLALDLTFTHLTSSQLASMNYSKTVATMPSNQGKMVGNIEQAVAYAVTWDDLRSAKALSKLLRNNALAKVSVKPFELPVAGEYKQFPAGSVVLPVPQSRADRDALVALIQSQVLTQGVDVYAMDSGLSRGKGEGVDLGSPSLRIIKEPKPVMLVDGGVSSYEAGEMWHLLDTKLALPLAMRDSADLNGLLTGSKNLDNYTHLIMVNGQYPALTDEQKSRMQQWLSRGGNLIVTRGAARWAMAQGLISTTAKKTERKAVEPPRLFSERDDARAEHIIGGAIYHAQMDTSHPLTYGMDNQDIYFTKSGSMALEPMTREFVTVATYSEKPLAAGYSSEKNIANIKQTPAVIAQSYGRGSVVVFVDNPVFRGYWLGSARLLINSLFFNGAF